MKHKTGFDIDGALMALRGARMLAVQTAFLRHWSTNDRSSREGRIRNSYWAGGFDYSKRQ